MAGKITKRELSNELSTDINSRIKFVTDNTSNIEIPGVDEKLNDINTKYDEVTSQLDSNTKQLNGTGININVYNYINDINERITLALTENAHIIIPEGEYNINGFEIPAGKIVECIGNVVFNTTNTILVGANAVFYGKNTVINASKVTTDNFSIVKLSKGCKVNLYRIIGYKKSGESKGNGTVAKGIDATHSDFVNVYVTNINQCKYAYYIKAGASGTGLTINDSTFVSRWIADCYYGFYQDGDSQTHIYTEAYLEYCNVGYSLCGSFYGRHYMTFDAVDLYFENRNTNWRTRMGEVYIPNFDAIDLFNNVDNYFQNTTFHMRDCVVLKKSVSNANIVSAKDSKIYMKSGKSSVRLTSDTSTSIEGKVSVNDTSDGCTITIGDGGYSDFVVEKANGDVLFKVSTKGTGITTRNGLTVGDPSVGYGHLKLSKGCLVFGEKIYNSATNAPNNSVFIDYSDSKLKFKDANGSIKAIQLVE